VGGSKPLWTPDGDFAKLPPLLLEAVCRQSTVELRFFFEKLVMRAVTTSLLAALAVLIAAQSVQASVLPVASLGSLALGSGSRAQAAKNTSDASLWTRMATGTKNFFTGIKDAVTPKSRTRKTTTRYFTPGSSPRHKTTEQKSSLTSWLHPKESSNK
jgi:hypothetical protein